MNKKSATELDRNTDWSEFLKEQLKDPKARAYYDKYGKQLELAYNLLQLRKKAKMSQKELAEKVGTTQSNIARVESGRQNLTIQFLQKIADVFKKQVEISLV